VDGNGLPLTGITTKANVADINSALATVDALVVGRRRRRPKRLCADKGYDSSDFRKALRQRGIKTAVDHREFARRRQPPQLWNDSGEKRYSTKRWSVEQRFACLDQNRRLDFLYERTRDTYEAFLTLARIRCYLKRFSRCRKRIFR